MSDQPRDRRPRPLRPAVSTSDGPSGITKRSNLVPKRTPVVAACEACRKHKTKCSGHRPACHRCLRQRLRCVYDAQPGETPTQALKRTHQKLQEHSSSSNKLIDLLKSLPETDAQTVLQQIRAGADVTSIVKQVEAGDLLLQMAVSPETRFRYEFPYRSTMPSYCTTDNVYLNSFIFEAATLYAPGHAHNSSGSQSHAGPNSSQEIFYLKPFHAARVVDPLLYDAKPSTWTSVCSDDSLTRELLTVFFRCEYEFTSAFQKTYFLEDMAANRYDFCSSLLVNVVLAYCCVCYPKFTNRAEYWNPDTLMYRFLAEAKRLWELEASEPRLTTIQAGIVFNVIHNLCGLDEIGQAYRVQAVALANQLNLFDSSSYESNDRLHKGKAYTAWALFNWETLVGFSFMIPPLLKKPPNFPLPDPAVDPQWYGETWVQFPTMSNRLPVPFGQGFKAKSEFRLIMNKFCQAAYSDTLGVTFDEASNLHSLLETWYNALPPQLRAESIALPSQLQLHMYYHHLLLCIFEPLLGIKNLEQHSPDPSHVVAEATKHLETLVRLYYLRHGYDSMDLFIVIPLMLIGVKCINMIDAPMPPSELEDVRSTLILVSKGLHSQRRNHYLAEALFRVIRGKMTPQEINLLRNTMDYDEAKADEKLAMTQAVRSHWPVSVVRRKEDLESNILKNLVDNYAHLNIDSTTDTANDQDN